MNLDVADVRFLSCLLTRFSTPYIWFEGHPFSTSRMAAECDVILPHTFVPTVTACKA
jgi:hypothetical protein